MKVILHKTQKLFDKILGDSGYLNSFLKIILQYRLHVSFFMFLILFYISNKVLDQLNLNLVLALTLWHFALYLFDRVYDKSLDKNSQPSEYFKHSQLHGYLLISLLLISSGLLFYYSKVNIVYFFILLPFTFIYTIKLFKGIRIKDIFFIKNLYSAVFVWSLPVLVLLHSSMSENKLFFHNPIVLFGFFKLVIALLVIEALWDIRDLDIDKENNIKTIPNVLGIPATRLYIFILIFLKCILFNSIGYFDFTMIFMTLIINKSSHYIMYHIPVFFLIFHFLTI